MIRKILTYYSELLNDFLKEDFKQPEGVVEVSAIGGDSGLKNKMIISLLSVDRDTTLGIVSTGNRNANEQHSKGYPALYMNLNIILAAMYDDKRYIESLSVLSTTLLFMQTTPSFVYNGITYAIEIISPSSQELNNIWTNIGGQYHPSVLCKIKGVTFDAREIKRTNKEVSKPILNRLLDKIYKL